MLGEAWIASIEWTVDKDLDEQRLPVDFESADAYWQEPWGEVLVREDFLHTNASADEPPWRRPLIELHVARLKPKLAMRDVFFFETAPFMVLFYVKSTQYHLGRYEEQFQPTLNLVESSLLGCAKTIDENAASGRLSILKHSISKLSRDLNEFEKAIGDCRLTIHGLRLARGAMERYHSDDNPLLNRVGSIVDQISSDLTYYNMSLKVAERALVSANTIVGIQDTVADQRLNRIVLFLGIGGTLIAFSQVMDREILGPAFSEITPAGVKDVRFCLVAAAVAVTVVGALLKSMAFLREAKPISTSLNFIRRLRERRAKRR
jgi:hypothetical protein